jgi:hypothetical protein
MNKVPTIQDFRKAGYKVRVDHRRLWKIAYIEPRNGSLVVKTVENTQGVMNRGGTPDENGVLYQLLPKGGRTEVTVIDPNSKLEVFAYADCHSNENYNKTIGVEKSLERVAELVTALASNNEDELGKFLTFLGK